MPGWETIVVIVIVIAALAWAARGIWRASREKRICSSCASSGGCPLANGSGMQPLGSECEVSEPLDESRDQPPAR